VVADTVSVLGTAANGFLQNDACWRELDTLPSGALRSPFYVHLAVDDRPGVLADVAQRLAAHDVSIARLVQVPTTDGAVLHIVVHEAAESAVEGALADIAEVGSLHAPPFLVPVVSDRGVTELGWA
jgi:predicted amino acid-binding ACT domain protein